ncbi:MAG: C-GCAxxG-C-C family protein [Oscillospiraceae bacterium]|nr:C-GCAxxG-C-C family protein [Oscillospiraceae bacterium]
MTCVEKAVELFERQYNCAQAVLGGFAERLGVDEKTAMLLASSLGGGIAHTGEACGAALGMCLAIGAAKGYAAVDDPAVKPAHNARVKAMMEAFRAHFGAMDCKDLQEVGNRARCTAFVRFAAELVEKELEI